LATAGAESKVLVWDAATRTLNKTLVTSASINTLVFDIRRRKDILLAGDETGAVSRWDVARGELR
jgi:hypothetical protein